MLRSSCTTVLRDAGAMQRLEKCIGRMNLSRHSKTTTTRFLSSAPPKLQDESSSLDENNNDGGPPTKQPFATANLEPGEWDLARKDPYFRPKPPRTSKLISAEDFANRNPVAFEGDFETYGDAMISLTWLEERTCRQIYQMYIDMMIMSHQKHNQQTSHEYVCRVIAQKFNINVARAAAVVQLQHDEEQMRLHKPELLCEAEAKIAEERILQNIKDAYRAERSEQPREFLEEPVGAHGLGEPDEASRQWTKADDLFDLDAKLEQANVRDAEYARLLIDGHVYKEDVDESKVLVYTDAAAKRLVKAAQKQQRNEEETATAESTATPNETTIPFPETNSEGVKRPRWKYVAKVVNTRAMKKKGRKVTTYTNNNVDNTLVEHDGELRVATVEEAKQTAWKPTRTKSNEYIFEGAKRAWLDKTLDGKTDVWGRMPITRASEGVEEKKEDEEAAATAAAAAAESEESSSSDESEGEEADTAEGEQEEDSSSDESDTDSNEEDKEK